MKEPEYIYIGEYKELNPDSDYPSMKKFFASEPYAGQQKIANYLRHGQLICTALRYPHDAFTGGIIPGEEHCLHDGKYCWGNVLAYYVEKYNLRLPKDFEDHVLSQSGRRDTEI